MEAEDAYRAILRETRAIDAGAGRTTRGAHLSDMKVEHGPKQMPAELASRESRKPCSWG